MSIATDGAYLSLSFALISLVLSFFLFAPVNPSTGLISFVAVEFQRERTKELTEKSPGSFADNILQFATDASDSSSRTFACISSSSFE